MERKSVGEYLANFLAHGRECAYVQRRGYRTARWSYRRVAETAFQFARELQARGVTKGDRVLIWGPNSAEWVAIFLACAVSGVVAVPIDDVSTPDFAQKVFQSVSARLLICSANHSAVNVGSAPVLLEKLPEQLESQSVESFYANNIEFNDPLQIVFTSGTTAEPKGVVITHGNVLANVAPLEIEIRKYIKYERLVHPLRFLNLLPLSHVFGQFLGIFLPQLMAGTVIFQETLKPSEIFETIRRDRVSVLVGVPRILQSMKQKIERDLGDEVSLQEFRRKFQNSKSSHFLRRWWIFRGVRKQFGWKFWAFICGGAALDTETEAFWNRLGFAVIQGYGLTETTSLISLNHPFRPGKGSIGKIMAGREVKLAPDGEIMVRGAGVAKNYWDGKQLRPVTAQEGWYRTGDIGELDQAGNLHFKGRVKDVIVTPAGMNIYPDDLEAALRMQPEIRDCAVIGLPLEGNDEPCAVLILRDRGYNPATIIERVNRSLAEYQQIRKWHIWPDEDFPRTGTQKPRKNLILESMLATKVESSTIPASDSLSQILKRVGGVPSGNSSRTDLETDLNLSSLDRVALMSALEDRYQIDLSEATFASAKNVGDVERIVQAKPAQRIHFHYPDWVQRWPATWVRWLAQYLLLRPAVFFLVRPRVTGAENVRHLRGPALVICNHITDVDFGFVLAALPRHLGNRLAITTAGEELEALRTASRVQGILPRLFSRLKWFLAVSLLNLFPLPRQAGFRESFTYAGESADRGYNILVFPEGGHTVDGKLRPFRAGIGLLANNLQIPIIPMRIHGLFEINHSGRKFAPRGQIEIRIGEPVVFRDQKPDSIAKKLQEIIERL